MCLTLAHILLEDIDIMENTLENDKLKIFYDYFVEQ